jgi:hypothetical protein
MRLPVVTTGGSSLQRQSRHRDATAACDPPELVDYDGPVDGDALWARGVWAALEDVAARRDGVSKP